MAKDTGEDLEHCQSLLNRVNKKCSDQSVDQSTINQAKKLGDRLISQGSDSNDEIRNKLREISEALVSITLFGK